MKLKCPKCKYDWETKSKLDQVTCPNCQLKVKKNKKKLPSSEELDEVDKGF